MNHSVLEVNYSQKKSVINMLTFYQKELRGLIRGKVITDDIPKGTRTRLIESGILRKFGSKFELTDEGTSLLQTL